jgi:hypothetical protein
MQLRHLFPSAAIEETTCAALLNPPPLLKEKSHMIVNTTVTYLTNPAWIDGPSATAAFTSNNDPSNSIEIEMVNRP